MKREDELLRMGKGMRLAIACLVLFAANASPAPAQQPPTEKQESNRETPAPQPANGTPATDQTKPEAPPKAAGAKPTSPRAPFEHKFWDRENDWLFAGVGAGRALDYASTLNLRRRGIDEVFLNNAIVDNHPLFAGIEVAGTAASIGASYIFHRTGHHRLERWTSIIHFGIATGGAIRNYALKTPH